MDELQIHGTDNEDISLGDVVELITEIIDASKLFRDKIEEAYDYVELAFLKRLIQSITIIEHDAIIIREDFIHMQQELTK